MKSMSSVKFGERPYTEESERYQKYAYKPVSRKKADGYRQRLLEVTSSREEDEILEEIIREEFKGLDFTPYYHGVGRAFMHDPFVKISRRWILVKQSGGLDI